MPRLFSGNGAKARRRTTVRKRSPGKPSLHHRLERVKLFLCDVDGVLTDASVFIGGPEEIKRFNIQDGLGLRLLQGAGVKVGWISNRASSATELRAQELKVDFLNQDPVLKLGAAEAILAQSGFGWDETCYVGDDIVDLCLLKRAGLAVTVPHAIDEVKQLAHYVTRAAGGHGAVREIIEMILKAQGKWAGLIEQLSK
jgi:3-deoxy-D-manno-octulosonate 8-phosphate phosphatase (KDO 8-P phosphatase)